MYHGKYRNSTTCLRETMEMRDVPLCFRPTSMPQLNGVGLGHRTFCSGHFQLSLLILSFQRRWEEQNMEQLEKYITEHKQRFLDDLKAWLRIPSVSTLSEHA